jgi:hypothetical protein
MQPDLGPMQQSFLSWILTALGFKYAILLPGSALVGFVLTLIIVVRGKGPMAGVALVLIVPVPLLIGLFEAIEGGISSFKVIATLAKDPAPGQVAAVISTVLVAPMVGMLLMAPSYILATLGSLFRSFSANPESIKQQIVE